MTDKDLLTMLTREDSAQVACAIIESQREMAEAARHDSAVRLLDHELWKKRQDERHNSQLQLDHYYRWHVIAASVLNMVSTAAIVLLVLKVVTVL